MSTYDTIKAQEVNFPIPQPTGTITVGTLNAATGKFQYAVPTYTQITSDPPVLGQGGSTKPTKVTLTGGNVQAVNIFDLKLQFNVTNRHGGFSVTMAGQAPVQAPANQNFVVVDVGTVNSIGFSLAFGNNTFDPDLPLTISRQIVGAGAITIPVLPISILYAPPVDQQKKNVASWTSTDTAGNTTTVAFSNQSSTTNPTISPFDSWLQLTNEMKVASQVLSKIPNPYTQAIGGALGVISGLLGTSTTTGTEGTTVTSQQTLTVTVMTTTTVSTNPTGGGAGKADVFYFLKNAQICWFANNGPLKLALIGWDAVDAITASMLQDPNGPTGLDQATRNSLLVLDPFAAGGSAIVPPPPRFVLVDTYGVNATQTYNLSYTITNSDLQQTAATQTWIQDDTASFLAFANIGVTDTSKLQTTMTQTSATQTTTTRTITRQVQFFANPTEYYSVEVYCDVVFGTFAFRSVGSTVIPPIQGLATDKLGKPLPFSEVTLLLNGQTFKTMTDANGQYSFRASTITPGTVQLTTQGLSQTLKFTGTPLHNLKFTG
jgi:hypothetical protein